MPTEPNLNLIREADDLHRAALEQQTDRTANQIQTLIDATAAQTIQRLTVEASARESASVIADNAIGNNATDTIRQIVASEGFTK